MKKVAQKILYKTIQDIRLLSGYINKDSLIDFNIINHLKFEIKRFYFIGRRNICLYTNLKDLPLFAKKQIVLFRILQDVIGLKTDLAKDGEIHILTLGKKYIKVITTSTFTLSPKDNYNIKYRIELLGGKIFTIKQDEKNKVFIILPTDK